MPSTDTTELGPGLRRPTEDATSGASAAPPAKKAPAKKAAAKKAAGQKAPGKKAPAKVTAAQAEAAAAAAFEARRAGRDAAPAGGQRQPALKAPTVATPANTAPVVAPEPDPEPVTPAPPPRVSPEEERRLLNRGIAMTRNAARKREEASTFITRRTQVYVRLRDGGVPIDVIADTWGITRQALEKAAKDEG